MALCVAKIVRRLSAIAPNMFSRFRARWLGFWWGMRLGRRVSMQGKTLVHSHKMGQIVIGDGVRFNSNPNANLVGLMNPTILHTVGDGKIIIGAGSGLSAPVISARTRVKIGCRCFVGGNARIFDHDFHSVEAKFRNCLSGDTHIRSREVIVGDDCFIGTNAILLKGTRIGARSVVAAGSVVFGLEVPEDSIVMGNPARVVKRIDN